MYEKSGDRNNLLQVQVRAVILVGHISMAKFLQGIFSPKCICLAHLTAQQSPQELLECIWWELALAVCVTQSMLLVLALLCWQARVYSLPFQPLGACLSPALAVIQLFCSDTGSTASMQGVSLNLIYCKLTQPFNYWFTYWGEKKEDMYNWTLGKLPFLTFLQALLQSNTSAPSFLTSVPFVFTAGSHFLSFPVPSVCWWAIGVQVYWFLALRFTSCPLLSSLLTAPVPSVAHPWPVEKCCAAGLLPTLADTSSLQSCQENKMGVFYHTDLCSQWNQVSKVLVPKPWM